MSGIVVAGTHSGCGKTTVTLGLMAALVKKGLVVQPFKAGPDYIDAGLQKLVTGRVSRNLDLWMCGEDYVGSSFRRGTADADIGVVEGVMGLYDGERGTAALAACLRLPVILVVDASGMAETAGAIVKGLTEYQPPFPGNDGRGKPEFGGVIFNRVASERHYERLCRAVTEMPVLGYLPRDLAFEMPHRHLGLVTAEETPLSDEAVGRLADAVLSHIDVERIASYRRQNRPAAQEQAAAADTARPAVRIAVARDRAFCFYYEDNFDLLREAGAELIFFSPLDDAALPAGIDGIYLGGGYPELHAEQLSANHGMRKAIQQWAEDGGPVYAECGGLMYLSQAIENLEKKRFEMAGVFPFGTVMGRRLARLGYREISLRSGCLLGEAGCRARGHEFHYSGIAGPEHAERDCCYTVRNAEGLELTPEGHRYRNVLGSYIHLHFGSSRGLAESIANFMKKRG